MAFKPAGLPAPKCFCRPCQGKSPNYTHQLSVFQAVQAMLMHALPATLPATGPQPLFFTEFKPAILPALKCSRRPCQGNSPGPSYRPQPSVFNGVHACRLLGLQMLPTLSASLSEGNFPSYRLQSPVICFSGSSSLPLAFPTRFEPFRGRFQSNSHSYK